MADGAATCPGCGALKAASPAKDERSQFPEELRGPNGSALIFNWIWAFQHGLWGWGIATLFTSLLYKYYLFFSLEIIFLEFSIFLHIIVIVIFHLKANRLAWEKGYKFDLEQTKKHVRTA